MDSKAYTISERELADRLNSRLDRGLVQDTVAYAQKQWGKNILPSGFVEPIWMIFLRQFKNPLIYLLLGAALLIFLVGSSKLDVIVIGIILLFNAAIGTFLEGKTRAILQKLSTLVRVSCVVIRDGKQQLIRSSELVPGDIIVVSQGDRIPADGRIIEASNVRVDQSLLTGESLPVHKSEGTLHEPTALADRSNMVYKGTIVTSGRARILVTATGINTQVGQLGIAAEAIQTDAPIKAELTYLSYVVLLIIVLSCSALLAIGLLMKQPFFELIALIATLFVCVVPEGLPMVLTLVLVRGVYQMAQKNVVARRMQAVEGLGRANTIVMDKTGTLTLNQMMVTHICTSLGSFVLSGKGYSIEGELDPQPSNEQLPMLHMLSLNGYLLNTSELFFSQDHKGAIKGDPTEAALAIMGYKLDPDIVDNANEYRTIFHMPFHSDLRIHVAGYAHQGEGVLMVNGAPEEVLRRCSASNRGEECTQALLGKGLRLIALAYVKCPLHVLEAAASDVIGFVTINLPELIFLGVCGISDTVRQEAKESIVRAQKAGVAVIMATGDHAQTALAIARQTGLVSRQSNGVILGSQMGIMSDEELEKQLQTVRVFARMTPQDKLRLVRVLQKRGNIVAMTGDGINDVPSLAAADLGIAMGQTGSDIAKYTADIVLYDDSFSNIFRAILFGRYVFYTLQRVIVYFFSTNLAEMLLVLCALLCNVPLPLAVIHILWINLVTDGFLDTGLSFEPIDASLLQDAGWLQRTQRLVSRPMLWLSIYLAIPMAVFSFVIFIRYMGESLPLARTMTLTTLSMFQWFNAWNCRSLYRSLFSLSFFDGTYLLLATVFVLVLHLSILYIPVLQDLFHTVPLNGVQWSEIILFSSSIIAWDELRKWLFLPDHKTQKI